MLLLPNEENTDWRNVPWLQCSVRMAYVLPVRLDKGLPSEQQLKALVQVPQNQFLLYWCRPVIRNQLFPQIDFYDILGVSAMCYGCLRHQHIHQIIG